MNDDYEKGRWTLADTSAADVLARLPKMDRVMVIHAVEGVLHERLGVIEKIETDNKVSVLTGVAQSSRVETQNIDSIVLQTTSVMRDKMLPSLGFYTADDELVFRIVGLEGAAAFLEPIRDIPRSPCAAEDAQEGAPESSPPEDLSDDPGFQLLEHLREAAVPVAILITQSGREQAWRGTIESVKPMMGHTNVMTRDFHLHLKAGSIAAWKTLANRHLALNKEGRETGLVIVENPAT